MNADDDSDDNSEYQYLQGEVGGEEMAPVKTGCACVGIFGGIADGQACLVDVTGLHDIGQEDSDGQGYGGDDFEVD